MRTRVIAAAMVVGGSLGIPGCGAEAPVADQTEGTANALALSPARGRSLDPRTEFYLPAPDDAAVAQIKKLVATRKLSDALKLMALTNTPRAAWFLDGTPCEVKKAVHQTMVAAERDRSVPVLVAYNLPYRDCAQYSGGGAVDTAQLGTRTFWRSGAATATSAKLQKKSAPPATCNKARARSALTHASLTLPSCV
jgi:hypothetical protein